jgi:site-specific DNA recombinase
MKVGYWRVSTASTEQLAAAENQRSRLEAAGVDRLLGDVGSGLDLQRPGYLELLELIYRRAITEVVLTRLDRLCRDAAASDALLVTCARRGVKIRTLDGGTVEADTPHGFLLSRMATSLAELESRQLSQRVRRGLEEGRKKLRPMRWKAPWGYQKTEDGSRLELDLDTAPRARACLDYLGQNDWRLYAAVSQAAPTWGLPFVHPTSLRAWVENPILRGGLGYRLGKTRGSYAEVHWDQHPALMSHLEFDQFRRSQELNRGRWGRSAKSSRFLLLSGLVVCAKCGGKANYQSQSWTMHCRRMDCENRWKGCHQDVIQAAILQALMDAAHRLPTNSEVTPEQLHLQEQIAQLERLGDPDLEPALALKRERLRLLQQSRPQDEERLRLLQEPETWALATPPELRTLFVALVDRVVVDRAEVQQVLLRC